MNGSHKDAIKSALIVLESQIEDSGDLADLEFGLDELASALVAAYGKAIPGLANKTDLAGVLKSLRKKANLADSVVAAAEELQHCVESADYGVYPEGIVETAERSRESLYDALQSWLNSSEE